MSESLRDEVAELARLLGAHIAWQRELGVTGCAPAQGVGASAVAELDDPGVAADRPAPAGLTADANDAASAEPPSQPTVRFEMPDFLRKRSPGIASSPAPRPAPASPAPTAVVTAPLAPPAVASSALAPEPPPVVRALFADEPPPAPAPPAARLEGPARLDALRVINDSVAGCTRCRLHQDRHNTVFARGNPFSRIAFVGEGPGRDEDLQGRPFVGAAGKLLDKIIAAMGLDEESVYICNVVKCRPPGNRVPEPDEMAACGPYLVSQLGLVRPELIVALGKTAASYLLQSTASMSKLRGRWHQWQGIPMLATWHPAYLLRQPEAKRETWDDMKLVLQKLGLPVPSRA